MKNFISSLLDHCWNDNSGYRNDPQYQDDLDAVSALEDKIIETMGWDFLSEYEQAIHQFREWEYRETFRCGIRFGLRFSMEVLGQPSSAPNRRKAAEISSQP